VAGECLNQDLVHFTDLSSSNRHLYFDKIVSSGNLSESCKLQRVYLTKEERRNAESIHNQTKQNICKKIKESIYKLEDSAAREYYNCLLECTKSQRKEELINLYLKIFPDVQKTHTDEQTETDDH